ncbi:hypothetical protein KGA66_28220 [Actinocrinis puniceicyclus]|uniref:Uncharacterized protein n=1 Tax=Actinocrinis puniceicyclus TaxID=977794 RepID=A0A8J8BF09_9ACTN|nr:hypothetical protein [Actinocrinis puniceicyclus]MBS2966953.1 hypothetical protein [Actinocrinis puniceicyclus]
MKCVVCDAQLPAPAPVGRPRRYCSTACRQRAYRHRHHSEQRLYSPARGRTEPCGRPGAEPLLAALVLFPLDEADSVYAAQSFAEFPWEYFLARLHPEQRPDETTSDGISSQRDKADPDAEPTTVEGRNADENATLRDEILC